MVINYTAEDEARCKEHWDKVRAGIYKAQPHLFKDDSEATIEACRYNASLHIKAAARFAGMAIDLAG